MVRVAVRRGGRKRPNAKGIVYGEQPVAFCSSSYISRGIFFVLSGCLVWRRFEALVLRSPQKVSRRTGVMVYGIKCTYIVSTYGSAS